jgi:hypothetical protein
MGAGADGGDFGVLEADGFRHFARVARVEQPRDHVVNVDSGSAGMGAGATAAGGRQQTFDIDDMISRLLDAGPWTSPTILTGGESSIRVGCERKTSRAAWQMAVIWMGAGATAAGGRQQTFDIDDMISRLLDAGYSGKVSGSSRCTGRGRRRQS